MGKFLFDWEITSTLNKAVNHLFSSNSLFDGYLTEH